MHIDVDASWCTWNIPCWLNVRRSGCLLFPHFALLSPSCACCLLHLPPCLFASLDCRWVQVSRRQWRMSTIRRFFFIVATMKTKKVLAGAVLSQKTPTATNCGQLWAMSIENWIPLCAGSFMEAFLETADGSGRLRKLSWKEDGDDDEDSDEVSLRDSNSFIVAWFS